MPYDIIQFFEEKSYKTCCLQRWTPLYFRANSNIFIFFFPWVDWCYCLSATPGKAVACIWRWWLYPMTTLYWKFNIFHYFFYKQEKKSWMLCGNAGNLMLPSVCLRINHCRLPGKKKEHVCVLLVLSVLQILDSGHWNEICCLNRACSHPLTSQLYQEKTKLHNQLSKVGIRSQPFI